MSQTPNLGFFLLQEAVMGSLLKWQKSGVISSLSPTLPDLFPQDQDPVDCIVSLNTKRRLGITCSSLA